MKNRIENTVISQEEFVRYSNYLRSWGYFCLGGDFSHCTRDPQSGEVYFNFHNNQKTQEAIKALVSNQPSSLGVARQIGLIKEFRSYIFDTP